MEKQVRVIVLASGKGSDIINIVYWIKEGFLKKTKLVGVIVDRLCPAFYVSKGFKVDVELYTKQGVNDLIKKLREKYQPDLLIMSGFMSILPKKITDNFLVVNIHPSLLPKLRGKDPQRRALKHKLPFTGVTLHIATDKLDDGPILKRAIVKIVERETEHTLCHKLQLVASILLLQLLQEVEKYGITRLLKRRDK